MRAQIILADNLYNEVHLAHINSVNLSKTFFKRLGLVEGQSFQSGRRTIVVHLAKHQIDIKSNTIIDVHAKLSTTGNYVNTNLVKLLIILENICQFNN